ncbi:thioesterase family protein [Ramlibacter algicola]|uniref:Thioesterase family protein n=1 Tax=Ramlibacter algicola TaxID=2795217 RepID=A0A934URE9_9BURK|nr:thioesterase family protein [Ramlibacter algicola]MBK0392786.1 thioesterase family protein [Ramlibacter algicola]
MLRNALTAGLAFLQPRRPASGEFTCRFRVLPWDVGVRTFKTDRYLAVVESAQVDFVIRAGLLRRFLKEGIGWVNVVQAAHFARPLRLLDAYTVTTRVECADDKHAYASFRFATEAGVHATVLLKTKFKQGRRTIAPRELLGECPSEKPELVQPLDRLG